MPCLNKGMFRKYEWQCGCKRHFKKSKERRIGKGDDIDDPKDYHLKTQTWKVLYRE